jgi:hypothetical protein
MCHVVTHVSQCETPGHFFKNKMQKVQKHDNWGIKL